ncbi:MAG: septum site-determining protein MinD [Ruminococcaceae bacterium]|nr:septum site-determining protein MinD [Oscillospiraceae bacterium]
MLVCFGTERGGVRLGTVIAVTSGKGGTGKTTLSGGLGSCLAALGYKTLCMDCDVGMKNLDLVLGMTDISLMSFEDVMSGRVSLADGAVPHPEIEHLYFITAPSTITPESIQVEKMRELMNEVREEFDYCVIDGPAGIGAGFRLAAENADMAIIVAGGDSMSLRDGQRTTAELNKLGVTNVKLVLNRVRKRLLNQLNANADDMIDTVGAQLLGIIPEEEGIMKAGCTETPVVLTDDKNAREPFLRIARRVTGERVLLSKKFK